MKRLNHFLTFILLLATSPLWASDVALPYDEAADPKADIQQALTQARENDKLVLLVFGANWCRDCRTFDEAMQGDALAPLINETYIPTKIDIGNWDRNQDVVEQYGNPTANGIPSLVIVSPDNQVLTATEAGELARARQMSDTELYAFLEGLTDSAQAAASK